MTRLEEIHSAWCVQDPNAGEKSKNYNALATMFWNTEGGVIRAIIN
jgi:hypothetical protein